MKEALCVEVEVRTLMKSWTKLYLSRSVRPSEASDTTANETRQSIQVQAKIAEIGAKMGFRVWIPPADRTRVLDIVQTAATAQDGERTPRSQLYVGYGADSGPSRGDTCTRTIRPFLPFGRQPLSPTATHPDGNQVRARQRGRRARRE